jgi:hypothetical protein
MSEGSCDSEHKRPQCPMKLSLRPWSRVFDQDLQLNTSPESNHRLWRSCFRRWMSTSALTTTSAKEGRKLTDSRRWPGASEEESTRGTSGQSTSPVRMTTKEASFKGHSTPHNLRGNNKTLSGRQLQGAEAPGASEEDLGISPGRSIAYFMVRTRAIPQECAKSPFRSKRRLQKSKLSRISRSRSCTLLRAALPTYQNM